MNQKELRELLERFPWKRVRTLPDRYAHLEKRVAELEARLAPATGDVCPKCRRPSFELMDTKPNLFFGDPGLADRVYRCRGCGFQEMRTVDPSKR